MPNSMPKVETMKLSKERERELYGHPEVSVSKREVIGYVILTIASISSVLWQSKVLIIISLILMVVGGIIAMP